MNSIKNNLRKYIEDTLGTTCRIGTGVVTDPVTSPQVVLKTARTANTGTFDGTPDAGGETINVHCLSYSESQEATDIHSTIAAALDDFTGTLVSGGRTVNAVHVLDQADEEPERLMDDDNYWFTETLSLLIQHQA